MFCEELLSVEVVDELALLEVFGLHSLEGFNIEVAFLTILFGGELLCLRLEHNRDMFSATSVGLG